MPRAHCCDDGHCLKTELSELLDPESPIVDRVTVAACAVAHTCGKLTNDDLKFCFSKLFEISTDCRLSRQFVTAYQTERDALEGKRDIEKHRIAAAGSNPLGES